MKVVPLGRNLIVKRLEDEPLTAGGVVLPESVDAKTQQGRVLSVGDTWLSDNGTRVEHEVGEGDRVLFSRYGGNEVVVDGQKLLILSEDEILAIVR
jgi:chaperonin GroES